MSLRAARAEVALRMRAEGKTAQQIADALGISRSYASALYTDPTAANDRVRKARAGGHCVACGAPTTYTTGGTATHCYPCRKALEKAEKMWTAETVTAAIRRWAAEHGRPPRADDWLHADSERGYPNKGSVYRNTGSPNAPFATWNDAITAAGFTAVPRGRYARAGAVGLGREQARVLAFVREHNTTNPAAVAKALGLHYNTACDGLKRLCRRGLVVKVTRGVYVASLDTDRVAA